MLGRKSYTRRSSQTARTAIAEQLDVYRPARNRRRRNGDADARAALEAFEPLFCNNMALVLDRHFVHRIRPIAGKDGNPLNEVELLGESLMSSAASSRRSTVIKLVPRNRSPSSRSATGSHSRRKVRAPRGGVLRRARAQVRLRARLKRNFVPAGAGRAAILGA